MKLWSALLLFTAANCFSGVLTVDVRTDKKDSIYKTGETAVITAQALEDGKPVSGLKVVYSLLADGGFEKNGSFQSDAKKPFVWKHKFEFPGALRADFTVYDRSGKRVRLKRTYDQVVFAGGRIGAVADPEKILPAAKAPADFAAYWQKLIDDLNKVKLVELERVECEKRLAGFQRAKIRLWDVKVSCSGKVPVSGYLSMPKNARPKSLPAILLLHGGGVRSSLSGNAAWWAMQGAIALDINAHGLPNGQKSSFYENLKKGRLKDYSNKKAWDKKEDHYWKGIALRVVRALQYLKTLPEWNGRDLVLLGASQGGWQGVVGAALDKDVSLLISGVPAYADFDAEFSPLKRMKRMHWGRNIRKRTSDPEKIAELLYQQSYYDPAHFAPMIRCKTFMTVGFVDLSCPATSVYAIYNRIPGTVDKQIMSFPGGVHAKCPTTKGVAYLKQLIRKSQK